MTPSEKSAKLQSLLEKAGINIQRATILGAYAHITSYAKYRDAIIHAMTSAGFGLIYEKDGIHLDELKGLRLSFKVT